MNAPDLKAQLAKIEKMLAQVVGVQKVDLVSPKDFLQHAMREIAKAQTESQAASNVRLSLLYKSVLYTSAIIEDADSDAIKVPIYVCDQTTLDEQTNTLKTPSQLPTGGAGSFFANVTKQLEELKSLAESLAKEGADDPGGGEGEDEAKGDDEDEEKKKAAAAAKSDEGDDKEKAKPAAKSKTTKSKTKDVAWPDDLNDKAFLEKGQQADPTWGRDSDR